jgi:signal transduction histidine kinase
MTHTMALLGLCGVIFVVRKSLALQRAQAAHARDLREQRDRLERAVAGCTEELRELTAHLQQVHEVERRKFARQLHDESLRDSGRGFEPTRSDTTRHGLRDLRHRFEALGGRLFVISAPGRGTEVEARLPLPAV